MKCGECGTESDGNFCPTCGARLAAPEGAFCPSCGAEADAGAHYCAECGEALRERPSKPFTAYLPWILSGLALVVFAAAITLFVQDQAATRVGDDPMTGGIISGGGGQAGEAPAMGGDAAGGSAMPSAEELAQMSPRDAADRLFNRAMTAGETDAERAPFFAQMGVEAYRRVPAAEVDADVRFHVGLLQLVRDDPAAARAEADTILGNEPGHLLGLYLALEAARAAGEEAGAAELEDRLREGVASTDLGSRQEYDAHRRLLEDFDAGAGSAAGGGGG
ncbi:MAG: zinc ribbon domain-containing protein [Gemmatimonadota bacterium]